jgi:signal transduction histidine kinase
MSFPPALPLNIAVGLMLFSVLGTLTGFWICLVVLRRAELRRLGTVVGSLALSPRASDKEVFGLPGVEDVALGLLRFATQHGGADFALLFLPKHGEDCMTAAAWEGAGQPWQDTEIPLFNPLLKRIAASGAPQELRAGDGDLPLPAHTMLFPIRSRGHLIALVAVGPRNARRSVARGSQQAIVRATEQVAVPLENAQLYASLRQAFTDLEGAQRALLALQRVSVAAQATLRLDEVLAHIAMGMVDGLPFDAAIVYLADLEQRTLSMPVVAGATIPEIQGQQSIPFDDENPAVRALLANEVLVTHDLGESVLPRLASAGALEPKDLPVDSTLVSLPLASNGQIIGGMTLATRRHAVANSEIESLKSFATQAAAAIENARLYGQLERAFSELRLAQDQLIRAERLRTLGQVASGVAHDFNNILAAIVTRAQLAQLQTRSAPLLETLRVIERAALDGATAARRIQGLARPQQDQSAEIMDLNEVIQGALELTRPMWHQRAQARGVSIRTETSFASDVTVEGIPGELREVVTNLILNATAAMPNGGTLRLSTERRGSEIWCTVEDTGTGMAESVRARIFDPFFTTKGEAGSGLGMSIVAAVLQRHSGRVEVDSEPGKGTSVHFGLPWSAGQVAEPRPKRKHGKVSLRLLLAETDSSTREALSIILTKSGHRVSPAADADEAMRLLVEQEFDVVITDLGLGEHTGWEVAEATKVLRPSAAVVLATAWGGEWDPEEARQRGVDSVLPKPFTVDEVLGSLEKALLASS